MIIQTKINIINETSKNKTNKIKQKRETKTKQNKKQKSKTKQNRKKNTISHWIFVTKTAVAPAMGEDGDGKVPDV